MHRVQEGCGATYVHSERFANVSSRIPGERDGREMGDGVGRCSAYEWAHRCGIRDIDGGARRRRDHFMTVRFELPSQPAADEPTGPGDEDPHAEAAGASGREGNASSRSTLAMSASTIISTRSSNETVATQPNSVFARDASPHR